MAIKENSLYRSASVFLALTLLVACTPMVSYDGEKAIDEPVNVGQCAVKIYPLNARLPKEAKIIGEVYIGDTGFTSTENCGADDVLRLARQKACEVGGDFFQITEIKEPNVWTSTCYRIGGYVGKFDFSSWETISRSEEELYAYFDKNQLDPIEGIWSESKNKYKLAIIKDDARTRDYVATILSSESPFWSKGQVKIEINRTASWKAFTANYFMEDHSNQGITILMQDDALIEFDLEVPYEDKTEKSLFLKNYPLDGATPNSNEGFVIGKAASSGSGFIVSRNGYLLTNYHVVKGCGKVATEIDGKSISLSVEGFDAKNDVALLKHDGKFNVAAVFSNKKRAGLGEFVMVAGYPLPSVLSSGINVSTGTVNALAGISNDKTKLQISAEVHPGNSGGPLLNEDGKVIGMVVSKVDALQFVKVTGDIPQNINFAIKGAILKGFLSIHGVEYLEGASASNATKGKASKVSQDITVKISCIK